MWQTFRKICIKEQACFIDTVAATTGYDGIFCFKSEIEL